jgi:hypothetical protein
MPWLPTASLNKPLIMLRWVVCIITIVFWDGQLKVEII